MPETLERPIDLTPMDTREIKNEETNEVEKEFDVLVINVPEKWKEAKDFKFACDLPFPGQYKKLRIPVTGLSYAQYDGIEHRNRMPDEPEVGSNDMVKDKYKKDFDDMRFRRRIEIFETCTNQKIPGATTQEKTDWLTKLASGDCETFFDRIINEYCNIESGNLLKAFDESQPAEIIPFNDFSDWENLSNAGSFFRMHRSNEKFLVEIPLKKLSEERKREIELQCKEPLPQGKPGKNPLTGKPDASFMEYNYKDPKYLAALHINNHKRIVLLLDELLPFEIPGKGFEEKFRWIGNRLLGDVTQLMNFIDRNIINYQGRIAFF